MFPMLSITYAFLRRNAAWETFFDTPVVMESGGSCSGVHDCCSTVHLAAAQNQGKSHLYQEAPVQLTLHNNNDIQSQHKLLLNGL